MPSGTYNSGGGQVAAQNVISLGCSCDSNSYPSSVSISFSSSGYIAFATNASAGTQSYDFQICNSDGSIAYRFATLTITGGQSFTGTLAGSCSATGLAGQALYCKAVGGDYLSYLQVRGSASVTVGTSSISPTPPPTPTPTYTASTFSASSVEFGASSKVTISNTNISALRHKVTWTVGSHTHTSSYTSVGATSASYTIPTSWMDAVPTATSMNMTISLDTYNGTTKIGNTATKTVKVTVPSSVVPTLTSVTAAVYNPVTGFSNQYIQGKTGVTLTFNGATPGTGATANTFTYTISASPTETISSTSTAGVYRVTTLSNSGSIKFTAYVKDARGRKSTSVTRTITVKEYSPPSFTSTYAARCTSNGTESDTGTYARIMANVDYSDFSGNSITINSKYYRSSSDKNPARNGMASGTYYTVGGGELSINYSWYIEFTATDTVGSSASVTLKIQSQPYAIHVRSGGTGVAFGKMAEGNNRVEINPEWGLYYKGYEIGVPIIVRTSATSHTFVVSSSSRQFVIASMGNTSRTWIGYIYCNSNGGVGTITLYNGANVTETHSSADNSNSITFTPDTATSCYVRAIRLSGTPLSNPT